MQALQNPVLQQTSAANRELEVMARYAAALAAMAAAIEVDPDGPDTGMVQPLPTSTMAFPKGVPWVPEHRLADWLRGLMSNGPDEVHCGLVRRRSDTLAASMTPSSRGEFDRYRYGVFLVLGEHEGPQQTWEGPLRQLLDLLNRCRNVVHATTESLLNEGVLAEGFGHPSLIWEGAIGWPARTPMRGLIGEGIGFSVGAWVNGANPLR
ncbi:MAG: hypothetical protein ACOC0P_01300 [Planctomycetota bacterium]